MTAKVLVTGASGFLGSRLARRLLDEGYQLSLLVRPTAALDATLKSQCHIVYGGLCDQNALELAVRDCEWIFHCAANVKTWDSDDNYYRANVAGVQHLLDALVQNSPALKRYVHISTVDVYGYPIAPADESSPVRKTGFGYGDSKLEGEQRVLRMASDHNLPFTIIRPGNIIGPGSQFISEIGTALKSGHMLTIGSGLAHAGLIDVDNLIDLVLWAADSDTALTAVCFAVDPVLGTLETPNGFVRFVQMVGIATDERALVLEWDAASFIDVLTEQDPLPVTDLGRPSLLDDPALAEQLGARADAEGSSVSSAFVDALRWEPSDTGIDLVIGALHVAALQRGLRRRVAVEQDYELTTVDEEGRPRALVLRPGTDERIAASEDRLELSLTRAQALELADEIDGLRGRYEVSSLPSLAVVVEPTEIRDDDEEVVEVIG